MRYARLLLAAAALTLVSAGLNVVLGPDGEPTSLIRDVVMAIDKLAAGYAALNGKVDAMRADQSTLHDKVDAMRADQSTQQSQLAAQSTQLAAQSTQLAELRADQSTLHDKVDAMRADQSTQQSQLAAQSTQLAAQSTQLAELLDSAPTPRSAALVSACAATSTWLVTIVDANGCIRVCTAFAYEPARGAAVTFLSAGHCYSNASIGLGHRVTLERLSDARKLSCIIASFNVSAHSDDAILDCPDGSDIPGLSAAPPGRAVLSLPVAAAGFLLDAFSQRRVPLSRYALTTMLARIGDVAGQGVCLQAAASPLGPSCDGTPQASLLTEAAGFVDRAFSDGMSGGPLLDMQCRVIGITSARGCYTGIFVNLSGVDARLAAARAR